MPDIKKQRSERAKRHNSEVKANQKALRESISETKRLVGESEKMLRRHRQERDADDQ
jgi:hypothetical protein